MKNISILQQTSLFVGNTFILAKASHYVWNHHMIRTISLAISTFGSIISVVAVSIAILGLALSATYQSAKNWQKGIVAQQFSQVLKDGVVLATISATGMLLI